MLTFYSSRIPDPGVKKAPDPGSATLQVRKDLLVKQDDGLVKGIQRLALEQDLLGGALVLLVVGVVAPRLLVVAPVDLLQPRLHHLEIVHAA